VGIQNVKFQCQSCKAPLQIEACMCAQCCPAFHSPLTRTGLPVLTVILALLASVTALYFGYSRSIAAETALSQVTEMQAEIDETQARLAMLTQTELADSLSKLSMMIHRISYSCGTARSLRYDFSTVVGELKRAQITSCQSDILELVSLVQRNIILAKGLGGSVLTDEQVVAHIDSACRYMDSIGFAVFENGSIMGRNSVQESKTRSDTEFAMSAEDIIALMIGSDASDCYNTSDRSS